MLSGNLLEEIYLEDGGVGFRFLQYVAGKVSKVSVETGQSSNPDAFISWWMEEWRVNVLIA
jgi:hypothetical protein